MTVIDVKDVGAELLTLLDRVRAGEEVLISDRGQPVARMLPAPPPTPQAPREFDYFKGRAWVADDFDDPLPPDVQAGFEK